MRRRILFIFLLPTLHVFGAILYAFFTNQDIASALLAVSFEWLAVITFPQALLQGYFPSFIELVRPAPVQLALMIIATGAVLLLSGVLLEGIARRRLPSLRKVPARWYAGGLVILCLVGLILAYESVSLNNAQLPTTAKILVDFSRPQGRITDAHWNFSQGGEAQMPEPGYFERAMDQIVSLDPNLIRIDHIYDYYDVLQGDASSGFAYDWTRLDRIVDTIMGIGSEPFICLSYMPHELARNGTYGPPNDWQAWEALVFETVRYYNIERQLGIRYWEVWNEPNLPGFWSGTIDDYTELYERTARAAKRADPTILIGGPSTSSQFPSERAAEFLERNYWRALLQRITARDLPLDFVSWHHYTNNPESLRANIALHESWLDGHDIQPQLMLTEWNYDGAFNLAYDQGLTNAYLAAS